MKNLQSFEQFLNEKRGETYTIEVSLRYASKAMDAFKDGNWSKYAEMTSTNTYEFEDEDMASDFYEVLTHDIKIPKGEIEFN